MNAQEIHSRLRNKFGDAVAEFRAPAAGDPRLDVAADRLHDVCRFLRDEADLAFDFLRLVSGVDRGDRLASVYHLYSYVHGHEITLSAEAQRQNPRVSSVSDLWPTADWLERETFDMMGIVYEGHPDLRRILLPEDWDGFPLRKDYVAPDSYNGITNL